MAPADKTSPHRSGTLSAGARCAVGGRQYGQGYGQGCLWQRADFGARVQLRGQWVILDEAQIEAGLRFFEQGGGQLTDGPLTMAQGVQDLQALGVAQGLTDLGVQVEECTIL